MNVRFAVAVLLVVSLHDRITAQPPQSTHDARRLLAVDSAKELLSSVDGDASPDGRVQYGDALLRAGKTNEAVTQFEAYLELRPQSRPYLWQYGIALFFEGRYQDARELFEIHRRVNPNDVENAAWHFLCIAKDAGIAEARQEVLPAPGDPRPPMAEILSRLPGGDSQAIEDAIKRVPPGPRRVSAELYGYLYLAMIADAEGNHDVAQGWIRQADSTPLTSYMADVTRVYRDHLEQENRSAKK